MKVIVNVVNVREEQRKEVVRVVRDILANVTEARCTSEELENISRDDGIDDETLEAEAYDWASSLEEVERRTEEMLAKYSPEDTDETNA